MASSCISYAISGDPDSGPCTHPGSYLAWDDDLQMEIEYCACHYGEPYDPAECPTEPKTPQAEDRAWFNEQIRTGL